jgi:hemerythrin-like domain-containing protein
MLKKREAYMRATNELKKEHQIARHVLEVLEKISDKLETGEKINNSHLESVLAFFEDFTNKIHHNKEEKLLLPAMAKAGAKTEKDKQVELLADHKRGRRLVRRMRLSLSQYQKGSDKAGQEFAGCARDYIVLFKKHMDFENEIILPLADKFLSKIEQDKLYDDFTNMEAKSISPAQQQEYSKLLKKLRGIYLID